MVEDNYVRGKFEKRKTLGIERGAKSAYFVVICGWVGATEWFGHTEC